MMTVSQLRFAQSQNCARTAPAFKCAQSQGASPQAPQFGASRFDKNKAKTGGAIAAIVLGLLAVCGGLSQSEGTAGQVLVSGSGDVYSKVVETGSTAWETLKDTGVELGKDIGDDDLETAYFPTIGGLAAAVLGAGYLHRRRKGG